LTRDGVSASWAKRSSYLEHIRLPATNEHGASFDVPGEIPAFESRFLYIKELGSGNTLLATLGDGQGEVLIGFAYLLVNKILLKPFDPCISRGSCSDRPHNMVPGKGNAYHPWPRIRSQARGSRYEYRSTVQQGSPEHREGGYNPSSGTCRDAGRSAQKQQQQG
jgi:hypothetical protein